MSMMDGMSRFESRIQQARDSYDQLQQITSEAQETIRRLQRVVREAKEFLDKIEETAQKKIGIAISYELNKISPKLREFIEDV